MESKRSTPPVLGRHAGRESVLDLEFMTSMTSGYKLLYEIRCSGIDEDTSDVHDASRRIGTGSKSMEQSILLSMD
jgi:hypothetical protein